VAYAQSQNQLPKLTLNRVKDDLYEIEGDVGNVGVYITSEGVILIDDKYDQDHEGILAAVKQVTPRPVKYVISAHHRVDHSGGDTKMYRAAGRTSFRPPMRGITSWRRSRAMRLPG
jgi:glyoxylase-like metal-dependent hydrolase (beta-lactamase superfamily II)